MPQVILLVDDTDDNRDMLARRLSRRGYTVLEARDGEQACEMVKSQKPQLILMDMQMPVLDGYEATRRLKADPETVGIPIIGLTAYAMAGDKAKVLEAGCNGYESKPVDLNALLEQIGNLLPDE